jgi:hypothetical protein
MRGGHNTELANSIPQPHQWSHLRRQSGPVLRRHRQSETPYYQFLDSVVLDCVRLGLPVKLYVAFPTSAEAPQYKSLVDRARKNGVGVLEITPTGGQIIHEALSLSLWGLRRTDRQRFPVKYRSSLSEADSIFLNGSPEKGCAKIYDEIEALIRRIAKKTSAKGFWKNPVPAGTKLDKDPWARILKLLLDNLDFKKTGSLNAGLLSRVQGVTDHRNDTGHKPKTRAALIKRDRELRTRFEHAVDLFLDLIKAASFLHV